MATVYLAQDLKHQRQVAIKVLKPEVAASLGAHRFLLEIATTANLRHPQILPLYDSGQADDFLYYVMPYVEGESLRDRLNRERQLPLDDAIELDSAMAEGYRALGLVLAEGNWEWLAAEREYRHAVALDPDYAPGHAGLSGVFVKLGRFADALVEIERAMALEPTDHGMVLESAAVLTLLGRYDDATARVQQALALEPGSPFPHVQLSEIAAMRNDTAALAQELEALEMVAVGRAIGAHARGNGTREDILRAIAEVQSPNAGLDAARHGWLYAIVGADDLALDAFERALQFRAPGGVSALLFPSVRRALGQSPRYRALVVSIGLEP